jgi:hypothetical protein
MSTGQLLDHTFTLYRKNFFLFVGIATVGPAANLVFQLLTIGSAAVPGAAPRRPDAALASLGVGFLVGIVVMLAGMALSQAATVKAVAAVHLGREITIAGAYKALRGRVWRVLAVFGLVMLLVSLGALLIILVAGLIGGLAAIGGGRAAGTGGAIVGGLVGLAAIVVGVLLAITIIVRYSLSIQACVVEDLGPVASLKRSAVLSKGARSRILTIYFVFGLLSAIAGLVLGALLGGLGVVLHNPIIALILTYLASFAAGCLAGPLGTIGISLLYYDERVRKEAFDLQLMMSSLDAPGLPSAAPAQI